MASPARVLGSSAAKVQGTSREASLPISASTTGLLDSASMSLKNTSHDFRHALLESSRCFPVPPTAKDLEQNNTPNSECTRADADPVSTPNCSPTSAGLAVFQCVTTKHVQSPLSQPKLGTLPKSAALGEHATLLDSCQDRAVPLPASSPILNSVPQNCPVDPPLTNLPPCLGTMLPGLLEPSPLKDNVERKAWSSEQKLFAITLKETHRNISLNELLALFRAKFGTEVSKETVCDWLQPKNVLKLKAQTQECVSTSGDSIAAVAAPKKKRAGRWNKQEKTAFLRALQIHGENWEEIADALGTRDVTQVRRYATVYFKKEQRGEAIERDERKQKNKIERQKDRDDCEPSPTFSTAAISQEQSRDAVQMYRDRKLAAKESNAHHAQSDMQPHFNMLKFTVSIFHPHFIFYSGLNFKPPLFT
jgi:hypothetical protein